MNRQEFLERLRILLGDLSEEEREEAVQYYENYFADAGPEMEEQVIKELGSPEKVALMIREGLRGEDAGDTYAENGFFQSRYDDREIPADYKTSSSYTDNSYSYQGVGDRQFERKPWTSKTLKIILIILIICVGFPVVIPVVGGVVAAILGLIAGIFGIFFAVVLFSFCIVIAGVAMAVTGAVVMFSSISAGLLVCGIGLLLLSAGILLSVFSIRLCCVMVPSIFRALVGMVRGLFYRGKERA